MSENKLSTLAKSFKHNISFINFEDLKELLKQKNISKAHQDKPKCELCGPKTKRTRDTINLIFTRVLMTLTIAAIIGFFICTSKDLGYLGFLVVVVAIWAETVYLCVYNKSTDFYWSASSLSRFVRDFVMF